MLRRSCIERLENRVLLAAAEIPIRYVDGFPIATVDWMGQRTETFAGRWVVKLDGFSGYLLDQQQQARTMLESFDATFKLERHLGGDGVFLVSGPIQMHPQEAQARLSQLPGFQLFSPDFHYTVDRFPDDPSFANQWGLHNTGQLGGVVNTDIDAPEAWDKVTGNNEVVVGVIDTGIDYTHPDIAPNIWFNPGEIPGNGIDDDQNGYIDDVHGYDFFSGDNIPLPENSHGTHVAGILGASGNNGIGISGVAWNIKMIACKIGGASLSTSGAAAINAMFYLHNLKTRPNNQVNVRVTNHSYGGTGFDPTMNFILGHHANDGILAVAAAGNGGLDQIGDNNDLIPHYPASYPQPNIISVANLTRFNTRESSSNFGPNTVHIAAPGTDIFSTIPGNTYTSFSGTSMASPFVAGVAALCFSLQPNANYADVRSVILQTAVPVPAFSGMTITGGRVNANAAVTHFVVPPTPTTPFLVPAFDSGISNSDNITSFTNPRFQGAAPAGFTVQLLANGSQVGSVVVPITNVYQVQVSSPLPDGVHDISVRLTNGVNTSDPSPPLQVTIDTVAPAPVALFRYQNSPHSLKVMFGEDVAHSVSDGDFLIEDLATMLPLSHAGTYDGDEHSSNLTFDGVPILPDGNYRITVLATGAGGGISDVAGNVMSADYVLDFKFLTGDANNDGVVNLTDFNLLAQNFGQSPRDYSQGDFNYDGVVNLTDFNLLAQRFGQSLAPASVTSSTSASAAAMPPAADARAGLAGFRGSGSPFGKQVIGPAPQPKFGNPLDELAAEMAV